MRTIEEMNDNPLSRRSKQRYNAQPDDIKKKLDALDERDSREYQLKVIKRKRIVPQKGDVFLVSPRENLYFYGLVIKDNVNNINGEGLSSIMIFKDKASSMEGSNFTPNFKNLLIPPAMVGREYWTRGYFYNVDHIDESFECVDYGFYHLFEGKYCDEYKKEIPKPKNPRLVSAYGVSTIIGIAMEINEELIIDSSLAELP